MTDGVIFGDFIRRIRAGDELAARELVARYEPVIRREVRVRCAAADCATSSNGPTLPIGDGELLLGSGLGPVRPGQG